MEERIISQRLAKAEAMRADGENPYANDFVVKDLAGEIHSKHAELTLEALEATPIPVSIGGRVMAIRKFGKMRFLSIQDRSGRIQANLFKNLTPSPDFERGNALDVGDIVGVEGRLMRTRAGELSILVEGLRLLTKSMRPLPEKWHGLTDAATRYRQRYVDLIVNEDVRNIFKVRAQVLRYIRSFLDERDYLEVETPILQPLYGGANARPFKTHHNTMDMDLYLRIAPELNLKRLVVGGLHRVYDLNRCFRNEGISTRHNPEFTLLEFYQAFATYQDLMEMTEELLHGVVMEIHGAASITYGEHTLDFTRPFRRISIYEGLVAHAGLTEAQLHDREALLAAARRYEIPKADQLDVGHLQLEVFEAAAEHLLIQPTFVTDFPLSVSPLSRRKDSDPNLVDRFELYVAGRELANAFSELNDPVDQRGRFEAQVEAGKGGDEEAHPMDEDYVRALEYGLPPTAGEGIGVDRLVMLLTNSASIREVILFPLLRPEA
ncbi:lysine--tRNA ligase [Myxococcota bacterium]|nr:lysine--tRNA ligase [Myxococcota bacterium]